MGERLEEQKSENSQVESKRDSSSPCNGGAREQERPGASQGAGQHPARLACLPSTRVLRSDSAGGNDLANYKSPQG